MIPIKLIFLFTFFAIAVGFAVPESSLDTVFRASQTNGIIVRNIRSPQKLEANLEHSDKRGSSAALQYTHPLGDNWEAYAKASRDFRHNDSKGEIGLTYSF